MPQRECVCVQAAVGAHSIGPATDLEGKKLNTKYTVSVFVAALSL